MWSRSSANRSHWNPQAVAIGVEIRVVERLERHCVTGITRVSAVVDRNGRDQTIEHQIVPLVEYRELPVAGGDTSKSGGTVRLALGEGEICAVLRPNADVAGREP